MRITNKSNKVFGIGPLVLLPEETRAVPAAYEDNPILQWYEEQGLVSLIHDGKGTAGEDTEPVEAGPGPEEPEPSAGVKEEAEAGKVSRGRKKEGASQKE